jgi:hypothetical protein
MDPLTFIGAASSLIPAITGGGAAPAGPSRSGDISNNLLWQSPFMVGGEGNSADTSGAQTPTAGGSGVQAGMGTAAQWFPVLALVAGVVIVVAVVKR